MQAEIPLPQPITSPVWLHLEVSAPDVLSELFKRAAEERPSFALAALRVGVLSLRMAGGQVDAGAIREASAEMISKIGEAMTSRADNLTNARQQCLARYWEEGEVILPRRLETLVGKDGEL